MKIAGAIFDMDGTLLDTMQMWDDVCCQYLISRGITPEDNLIDKLRTKTFSQAINYIKDKYNISESAEDIARHIDSTIYSFYAHRAQPKPGVAEFLQFLHKNGVKMCIATSSTKHYADAALKRLGLGHYFDAIITCADVGASKDKPDIFHTAAASMGTDLSYTWVFEDSLYAARTAKLAGYPVCGIYDGSEEDQNSLMMLCDIYITSFKKAVDIFI